MLVVQIESRVEIACFQRLPLKFDETAFNFNFQFQLSISGCAHA